VTKTKSEKIDIRGKVIFWINQYRMPITKILKDDLYGFVFEKGDGAKRKKDEMSFVFGDNNLNNKPGIESGRKSEEQ